MEEIKIDYYKNGVLLADEQASEATHIMHRHSTHELLQVETGQLYDDPMDVYPSPYTYEISDRVKQTQSTYGEEPTPDPKTLEGAKALKVAECEAWNASSAICEFYFNGVPMWLTREERSDLLSTLSSAQTLGYTSYEISFKGLTINLPIALGFHMLSKVQLYASATESVKQRYLVQINALETIEEVNALDYKVGYPLKEQFVL